MPDLNEIVLSARQVRKVFGTFPAVDGIDLDIKRGECFGLLGPNGAGKSTLINMIYGTSIRTSGQLQVFGFDPTTQAREIKRRIGVVTQDNALDESLSVRENMELYAAFVNTPKSERKARVNDLLQFLNLSHKADAPIRFLSGGMKRRLVFVRALLNQPDLVVLDEPTTGLDPAVRHLLWGKINELKASGKTVLLTTHYMHEAEVLCDRLVVVNKGKVIAEGTPKGLREQYVPGFVAVFENSADQKQELLDGANKRSFTVTEDSSGIYIRGKQIEDLIDLQSQVGLQANQLRPSNLEDVFLKLTGQELTADA